MQPKASQRPTVATLEMTAQGRALVQRTADMAWEDARPLWDEASEQFARAPGRELNIQRSNKTE